MRHNQAPQGNERELSLQVLQVIKQISDVRQTAARLRAPRLGVGIGPRHSPLEIGETILRDEVNQTLLAIGGIQAVIGDPQTGDHLRLMQWYGPDDENPGNHRWLARGDGNFGEASLELSGLIHDFEGDS